ncbi:MAG: hypothetical protein AAGE59_18155 [Cyanobacteria bacterium P01_F01_bin.86]
MLDDPVVATETLPRPTRQEKTITLLKVAQNHAGQLSVTQAVMETGMNFEEVESILQDMVKSGYVGVDNHPTTGIVIYQFHELHA